MSKPKSTGWRSQNSHAWGHASTIAEQLTLPNRPITPRNVLTAMALELAEEGMWPKVAHEYFKGEQPLPWGEADSALANVMVEKLHAFADIHSLYLMEYDGAVAVKMWYGER